MEKIADSLAQYVMERSERSQADYSIIKYGFQVGLEVLLCLISCILISALIGMPLECVFVLTIFFLLRSYCGGIHLDSFFACFLTSNIVVVSILILEKYSRIPLLASLILIVVSSTYIFFSEPVETKNKKLDLQEKLYFKKKMRNRVTVIFLYSIASIILWDAHYIKLLGFTMVAIFISMVIGKRIHKST